jgi:hypothetical protein
MVSPRWVVVILLIFMVGALLSSVIEMTYFGDGESSKISQLMDEKTNIVTKAYLFWEMSWFDFAMFKNLDGTANAITPLRWGLMILSIAFWFTIMMSIGQGVTSIVKRFTGV